MDISEKNKSNFRKKLRKFKGKFDKIIKEILHKFWIKISGNFDRIILNKIFIEFKVEEQIKKILKSLDYFSVKFELISTIEVK